MTRFRRTVVAIGTASALILAAAPSTHALGPFPQNRARTGDAGVVSTSESIELVGGNGAGMADATKFTYGSTDSMGRASIDRATFIEPRAPWTGPGPRPLVAIAPGTQGPGEHCDPSTTSTTGISFGMDPIDIAVGYELLPAAEHLSRGAAVVIIDHHRNPDTGSQEYVDNISSGQSLLDAAIAARGLDVDPTAPVGLHGYSQGGGTSGWAAENAHVYAPDLNDGGRRWLDASDGLCVGGSIFDSGFRSTKDFTATGESLKEVIFERYPFIIDELERQELGKRTPTHPTMLYAGVHDDIIPVNQIRKIRDAWTAGGADLKYVEDPTTSIPGKTAANHIVPMLSQLIPSIDFMWSQLAPGHQPTIPGVPGSLTPTLPGAPELPGSSAPEGPAAPESPDAPAAPAAPAAPQFPALPQQAAIPGLGALPSLGFGGA